LNDYSVTSGAVTCSFLFCTFIVFIFIYVHIFLIQYTVVAAVTRVIWGFLYCLVTVPEDAVHYLVFFVVFLLLLLNIVWLNIGCRLESFFFISLCRDVGFIVCAFMAVAVC